MKKHSWMLLVISAIILMGCSWISSLYSMKMLDMATTDKNVKNAAMTTTAYSIPDPIRKDMEGCPERKIELFNDWKDMIPLLPYCNFLPTFCEKAFRRSTRKWIFDILPTAKMYQDIFWGNGGGFLSLVALLCVAIGIYLASFTTNDARFGAGPALTLPHAYEAIDINKHNHDTASSLSYRSRFTRLIQSQVDYWTGSSFTFTYPVTTIKLYVALVLLVDLNGLNEVSVLATPEAVQLYRPGPKLITPSRLISFVATWLMPRLTNDETADLFVQQLQMIRGLLLLSWFSYLVIPPRWMRASGTCYFVGTSAYLYLAIISQLCALSHKIIVTIDFFLLSLFAVPFLGCPKHGPRAACWLRRVLFLGILSPFYLFAGVSKFRYLGPMSNLTGVWITKLFKDGNRASVSLLPSVFSFIGKNRWTAVLFSWGNIWMEFILPLAIVIWMENDALRTLFHISGVGFHASIWLLITPNFLHVCVLHLLASDPLGWPVSARLVKLFQPGQRVEESSCPPPAMTMRTITWREWMQVLVAFCCIFGWFRVNFLSDIDNLMGNDVSRIKARRNLLGKPQCLLDIRDHRAYDGVHFDRYLPFSENSMFTYKSKEANFALSLSMLVLSVCIYSYAMCCRRSKKKESNSPQRNCNKL